MPHVLAQDLRNAVLQAAIQGKLTVQSEKESAYFLIDSIKKAKEEALAKGKIKREKSLPPVTEDVPFDIPENWVWARLGDYCEKITDQVASGSFASLRANVKSLKTPDYALMVKTADFRNNFSRDLTYTDQHGYEFLSNSNLFGGELILSNIGSIGKVFIVPKLNCKMTLAPNSVMIRLTDERLRDYLYRFLLSPLGFDELMNITSGTAMKKFNKTDLKTILVPIPPIEEQARIVARIDELMAKIDEYETIEKELTELQKAFPRNMKDAILQAAMQGKLTEQLSSDTDIRKYYEMVLSEEKIVSKKEKEVSFTGEEPFDIPSNWIWVKLNDLVGKEIRRGKSPKYAKDGTAMAFAQKCNSKYTGIRLDLALCLDDNSLSRYAEHDKMQDLDVVINSTGGGTLGRIGLYKKEYNTGNKAYYPDSHVTVIRTKKCVSSLYIFRCLQYYSPYLETLGEGSTNQTELKPDVLKGLYIPLPPIEEQQRIVDKLDKLLPLCESLEAMI